MPRKKSITSQLYSIARVSNNLRAIRKGPVAYANRQVRKKAYAKSGGLTRSILKTFGLSK